MSDEMELPDNKTCVDCANYKRCQGLFGCKETNRECDWYPIRFVALEGKDNET